MTGKRGNSPSPGMGAYKTVPLDDGSDVRRQMEQAVRARRRPALVVIHGADVGLRCQLRGSSISVGRDPAGDLVLTDPGTSWSHACLQDRGDCWAVVDLGSTNGTLVNGEPASDAPLRPGDKITFGRTVVRFDLQDALEAAYGEMMERMLNIDDLSGLYVRRRFDAELGVMLSAAHESGGRVGLLVMDLDGIKKINDTHGHLFGAYVIGEVGHLLDRILEGRGIGTRFGGDEFVAAVPGYGVTESEQLGGQILQAVHDHLFERQGVVLSVGISIGVAGYPESATEAQGLFQCADEAMYRAKRGGKNQVCR